MSKKLKLTYLIIGILTFCYVLVRAFRLGVTYDEAYTLTYIVPLKAHQVINYSTVIANNHIANTLLIKLFFLFGSDSLFVARLPNVLALMVYLLFTYRITSKNLSPFVGISCFLLLVLNPFVLDFFSLARGYGLSFAFMMASLYYAVENVKQYNGRLITKSLAFAGLSVISNFAMLNFWIVLLFVINVLPLIKKDKKMFIASITRSVLPAFVTVAVLFEPIRKLRKDGMLFYGGDNNFYSDSLVSIAKYSLYAPDESKWVFICLNVFLIVLIGIIIISFVYKGALLSTKFIVVLITMLCVASLMTQHYLLGTLYLIDRTALFFYLLFILSLCFAMEDCKKIIQLIVSSVLLVGFSFNFFVNANFYKAILWPFDAHTEAVLDEMNEIGVREGRVVQFDYAWLYKSSVNYYMTRNNYSHLENVKGQSDPNSFNVNADFYIYLSKSIENTGYEATHNGIHCVNKTVFRKFPQEYTVVFNNLAPSHPK